MTDMKRYLQSTQKFPKVEYVISSQRTAGNVIKLWIGKAGDWSNWFKPHFSFATERSKAVPYPDGTCIVCFVLLYMYVLSFVSYLCICCVF